MSIGRMDNFNFSHHQSNLVKTTKKNNSSDSKVSLTPGLITGLAAGGAAHITLSRVAKNFQNAAPKNTIVSKIIGSMAGKAENIFSKEALAKVTKNKSTRAKTATVAVLGTTAFVTGLVRMFGGIIKPVFTSPESNNK